MTPRPYFNHRERDDIKVKDVIIGAAKGIVAGAVLLIIILGACYIA